MIQSISVYSLRTIAVTEFQWISIAATTIEDDTIPSVEAARSRNLKELHETISTEPPGLGLPSTWRKPTSDMKVTVRDTIVKQDLTTGKTLEERELAEYILPYYAMNPEEN